MAINFPASPTDGDIFDADGLNYIYVATKGVWDIHSSTQSGGTIATTDQLTEGTTNLYFTDNRIRGYIDSNIGNANEVLVVDATGSTLASSSALYVNSNSNFLGVNQRFPDVMLHVTGDDVDTATVMLEQYNNQTDSPNLIVRKSRGTPNSKLANIAADELYKFEADSYNGLSYDTMHREYVALDAADETKSIYQLSTHNGSSLGVRLEIDGDGVITIPGSIVAGTTITGQVSDISNFTTSDLTEGSNEYYTNTKVDARIALQVGANLDVSGVTTDDFVEGSNNLFYTQSAFNDSFALKNTSDLTEDSANLYYTDARVIALLGQVSGSIVPDQDVSYDLGSSTNKFRELHIANGSFGATAATTLETDTETEIDSFDATVYRSCKYIIQATDTVSSEYQIIEALVIHDGVTAYITQYGKIFTGAATVTTFDVSTDGSTVSLNATGASANSTEYKITRTLTEV